ncbi:MAG: glycosyltransferase [Lachnospiraceae bacterium]|nr:glycosyltransferase [Lachnospiraceae bacterium]
MPLVSIIVPVYNAEKTIERCINSILNQVYRDFELILLDDGSTDASGEVCDAYAEKDNRIRVLHKENSGVSDTRNQGIAMAEGEYLQFLDSDDWITPEATGLFVRTAAEYQCDMVIADFYRVVGERVSQKGSIEEEGLMDRADYAGNMMQKPADFYYGVLWNKFYKRSIIEKYQLKMDISISWCEDFMFNMEYVRHAHTIYALKVPVYYYVKTKGSLVSQGLSMKKIIQMKRTVFAYYNDFYKDVFDDADYEKRRGQVYRFLFDAASDGAVSPLGMPGNYRLGDERTSVSGGVLEGEGIFFDLYRERKLQEKLFDIVALRHDLTTVDVKLLHYLSQPHENCTYKEMADILNISRRALSAALQRLLAKGMIAVPEKEKDRAKIKGGAKEKRQEEKRRTRAKEYVTAQEAERVLSEALYVLCNLEQIQYEGFSQEEIELYEKLNEKRNRNIRDALKS